MTVIEKNGTFNKVYVIKNVMLQKTQNFYDNYFRN